MRIAVPHILIEKLVQLCIDDDFCVLSGHGIDKLHRISKLRCWCGTVTGISGTRHAFPLYSNLYL